MTNLAKISDEKRNEILNAAAIGGADDCVVGLAYQGQPITSEIRDTLLKKCAANEYVELELSVLAYYQKPNERNRNFVRIDDSYMSTFGKTGKGKPFLKDHRQYDTLSVCGEIIDCWTEELEGGGHEVRQKVKLTAPWAVDLALRGLLKFVSISWMSTGPVHCTVCNAPILTKCYHWPGDRLSEISDNGEKKLVWNRGGNIIVEWKYMKCEIIETSPVPVPAVKNAKIDGIRTSLSAFLGIADDAVSDTEKRPMSNTDDVTSLNAQIARLHKILALSPKERLFFDKLSLSAGNSFLDASSDARSVLMKPIYTSKSGVEFTDPQLAEMARMMDDQREQMENQLNSAKMTTLAARAQVELAHLPLSADDGGALLGAIDQIQDKDQRDRVLQAIRDYDSGESKKFSRQGVKADKKPLAKKNDASSRLDSLIRQHCEKHGLSYDRNYDEAMGAVMGTDEGIALYTEMETEKQNQRLENQGINRQN